MCKLLVKMKFALVFAACLVILATQGSVHGRPQEGGKSLVEDFKQAIKKLAETIAAVIANAAKELEKLIEKLKEEAQEILELIIASVFKQIEQIVSNIKELIEKAKQLDIDVKECVGNKIEDIENIPQKVIDTGKNCVKETVDDAKAIIDNTLKIINDYKNMINEFEGKWNMCEDVGCKIKLIVEATEMTIFIPGEITNEVKNAIELIKSLDDRMVVCLDKTLKSAIDEANSISDEITTCIKNKIPKEALDNMFM